MMRNKADVWEQLKRQLDDDPRFIVGTFVDKKAIEVFVKEAEPSNIKKYITGLMKDVAVVSERSKRSIMVELIPDVVEKCKEKEECRCAND